MRFLIRFSVLFLVLSVNLHSQTAPMPDHPWNFMNTKTVGAFDFIKEHPTYDGRGVIIIICDSGVDMGVPGLLTTSEGKTKIIDAQDFSGQGDLTLSKAERDSSGTEIALKSNSFRLHRFEALSYQPSDSIFWIAAIDESKHFKNSALKDINNNGKSDDVFAFVTFPVTIDNEPRWVYYIDEDADGNVDDETSRFSYRYNHDSFSFRGRDADTQKALLTFVLNIDGDKKTATFHAADNAHGTHCAGISAGYQIFGEPTQHGIAPGAQVISCKIGDGSLSGGSTTTGSMKKAYEYGVNWAKEHNVPVVFSMSYGVGSEIEGRSDIEQYLSKLMAENENILIVKSVGNSGPGLSSAGNPSCASRPLTAGAMFPKETARDVYGYQLASDKVFHFSSRGGETAKPDCITPGAAMSTVPNYSRGQNFWGTSMACPQLSGAAAVLISACIQENIHYNGALIKRALKNSASPLPGYTALDQGTGVVNIPRAFEIMKTYAARNEDKLLLDYQIETKSPVYADSKGSTAYWRTGSYFPDAEEGQRFVVKPLFPNDMTADDQATFFRSYTLKTDQPWLKVDKSSTFIRGTGEAVINVTYRAELLKQPGLYVGKVIAYPKSGSGKNIPEFELLNTIIVPYQFSSHNGYQLKIQSETLNNGDYHRYFVLVPPGATGMNIELAATPGKYCGVHGYIHDPEGIEHDVLPPIDTKTKKPSTCSILGEDLMPGIWEIVPYAFYHLKGTSTYDLTVTFSGIEINQNQLTSIEYENGKNPEGSFEALSHFDLYEGTVKGTITGYGKENHVHSNKSIYKFHFNTDKQMEKIVFDIELGKETWNLFTDVAINIKDEAGKTLKVSGMGQRSVAVTFAPQTADSYVLEINAAFAQPSKEADGYDVSITENYYLLEPISLNITQNGNREVTLYPGISSTLDFELASVPRIVPKGYHMLGRAVFVDRATQNDAADVRIAIQQ